MEHPFLRSWKSIGIYFTMWLLIVGIHIVILSVYYNQEFIYSLADGLIFNLIFAKIGLGIWYVVRYSKTKAYTMFFNHITTFIFVTLCWIVLSNILLLELFSRENQIAQFIWQTIPWRIIGGFFFYILLSLIYYLLIYYNNLQEKVTNEIRLQDKVKEAELNLLKSQINPHFLFNSLNSISSLTLTDCEKAQEMIIKLSEYLRYSVSSPMDKLSTFQAEIQNIFKYLEIEKIRFGSRLVYQFAVSEEINNMAIPAMILQPLYENAIKHGVYESTEPIEIITQGKIENKNLILEIKNSFDPQAKIRKGAGIGLKNIAERMKLIYGDDKLLKISKNENTFLVEIIFPQKSF